MRWIVPVAILFVLGVAGWQLFALHPSPRSTDSNIAQDVAEDAVVPAPAAEATRSLPGARAASAQRSLSHSRIQAQAKAIVGAGRNRLVGSYQSEPRSAVWAMQMEEKLSRQSQSSEFAGLNANPLNFSVRCRTSTCHITADFPSRSAADDWATLYVTNGDTGLINTIYDCMVNPDGSVHVELYGHPKS